MYSNSKAGTPMSKAFWTSFFDGLTLEGMFGDLRIPGAPTRMFAPEPEEDLEPKPLLIVRARPGVILSDDEADRLLIAVRRAVRETTGDRAKVVITEERCAGRPPRNSADDSASHPF